MSHTSSLPAEPALHPDTLFDGVDLRRLAERIPTPFHAYSASAIRARIDGLQQALQGLDATLCYAVKANSNLAILQRQSADAVA